MDHENSEGLFDRFFDRNCGWVGGVDVWSRANHMARSSSNGQFSADPSYDYRDSGYVASADRNEFTVIGITKVRSQNGHYRHQLFEPARVPSRAVWVEMTNHLFGIAVSGVELEPRGCSPERTVAVRIRNGRQVTVLQI